MRNRLLLAGLVPLLLAALFVTKVGLMLSAQASGDEAFGEDRFGTAAKEFAGNGKLNFMEPWLSPFNEGAARHQDADYDKALELYDEALEDVPDDEECTVRINIALVHEAVGNAAADGSAEEGAPTGTEAALKEFEAGIEVLAQADCPTDAPKGEDQTADAKAVDDRLKQKAEEEKQKQEEQQGKKGKKKQQKKSQQEQKKLEKKQKKLQKRNAQGNQERAERRQYDEYPYEEHQDEPNW